MPRAAVPSTRQPDQLPIALLDAAVADVAAADVTVTGPRGGVLAGPGEDAAGVATLHVPRVLTKELRLQRNAGTGEVWLRLSSNLLDPFGFTPDVRIARRVLAPGQGLEITTDPAGSSKVYRRRYRRRATNPFETQLDIKAQRLLAEAFPAWAERVHFTLEAGRIVAVPVFERAPAIRVGLQRAADPLTAFIALSSGVDAACLAQSGFRVRSLLEWRPPEKRDRRANGTLRDLSETGVHTALQNTAIAHVFNEDIRTIDLGRVKAVLRGEPPLGCLVVSPQCDDFSALKAGKFRAQHLADGDTTMDLTYNVLQLIEALEPATVLVENVPGYATSQMGQLLAVKLRQWGYHVHADVFDARDFGGLTSRRRFYLVASVFPGFRFPDPAPRNATPIWDAVVAPELPHCRDVSHTSSVRKGIAQRRIRLITPESTHAPTVFKSQHHQPKDGCYVFDGERYYFPSERLLARLNGIPDTFGFDCVGAEIATEQIGQSIEWPLHHHIAEAVRDHLVAAWQSPAGARLRTRP